MQNRKIALLTAASALALGSSPVFAQDADTNGEATAETENQIIVRGVRGSQEAAIDIKRNSNVIVDAIVAEDIGKLPDVTISDALQRVTGVQINRSAGEGSDVAIRGSGNVLATLNGERFLAAETLLRPRADFRDIPASLVSGINVYKSQSASQLDGGVGGIIDVRTYRALDLPTGLSGSASIQTDFGSLTEDTDYQIEGLLAYNFGNGVAMSLAASYSDRTLANNFQGTEQDYVDEYSTWMCGGGCGDLNGDGDAEDFFLTPLGWSANVSRNENARERLGLAYNFGAELSDGLTLTADVLYNKMDDQQNGQTIFVNGGFGGRDGFAADGSSVGGLVDASDHVGRWHPNSTNGAVGEGSVPLPWATTLTGERTGLRAGISSATRETEAWNTNLELDFDDGGPLRANLRFVYGSAEREGSNIQLAQQTNMQCVPNSQAQADANECFEANPGGIDTAGFYTATQGVDAFTFQINDPAFAALVADPSSYYLHSNWLETNFTDAEQYVLRGDLSYDVSDAITLDFGVRWASRDTNERRADYFTPSGFPGLLNKFNEFGYALGQSGVTGGTAFGVEFDPVPVYNLLSPELAPLVTNFSDFGGANINFSVPLIDASLVAGDFEGFKDMLYGQGRYITAPDRSYSVKEDQLAGYLEAKFNFDRFVGNVGGRLVRTELTVTQNEINGDQLRQDILAGVDPNHSAYIDLGDIVTTNSRTAFLPFVNLNYDVTDDIRLKLAYQEVQSQQPFENLGRGEITFFNTEEPGENFQRVSTIQRLGNPNLGPEQAKSLSGAIEWYPRKNTLVSLGVFYVDVESFTFQQSSQVADAPDSDGVVRRGATLLEIANGFGASYSGFEFNLQSSFDFLPGILGNFGTQLNYTYSPSENGINPATGEETVLADGTNPPLNGFSEHQANAVLFYQDDKFEARVAANFLSEQYRGAANHWSYEAFPTNGAIGIGRFQRATTYIDFSASYDVTDKITVFATGTNLTEEAPVEYVGEAGNRVQYSEFERVLSLGVRARF